MINRDITQILPYPGVPYQSKERTQQLHQFDDVQGERANSSGKHKSVVQHAGPVTGNGPLESGSQRLGKFFENPVENSLSALAGKPRTISSSQVLMQMIDEMGGTGMATGPGQLLDIMI